MSVNGVADRYIAAMLFQPPELVLLRRFLAMGFLELVGGQP